MASERADIFRDAHIVAGLFRARNKVSFVYRTDEKGRNKIFACFSKSHKHLGQKMSLVDSLAGDNISMALTMSGLEMEAVNWEISNRATDLFIKFKSGNKYHPGIWLSDSDTGYSSITARSIVYVDEEYVVQEEFLLQHSKLATPEKVEEIVLKAIASARDAAFDDEIELLREQPADIKRCVKCLFRENPGSPKKALLMDYLEDEAPEDAKEMVLKAIGMLSELEFKDRNRNVGLRRLAYVLPSLVMAEPLPIAG
jgi:hypothetical protein